MGKILHPIDLKTGKLQSAEGMEERFNEQFNVIEDCVEEAKKENKQLLESLEAAARDSPWSEKLKQELMNKGREMECYLLIITDFID